MQWVKLLQEENDELCDLLKISKTGKLKEEVSHLKCVVNRLEGSLHAFPSRVGAAFMEFLLLAECHMVISDLSWVPFLVTLICPNRAELDEPYETLLSSQ